MAKNTFSRADSTGDNTYTGAGTNNFTGTSTFSGTATFSGTTTLGGTVGVTSSGILQTVVATATLEEINDGKVLLAGVTGKTLTVVGYTILCDGTFEAANIVLSDGEDAPVTITTLAEAALADATLIYPDDANATNGAGFLTGDLTAGAGISVSTGGTLTTGTSVTFRIDYISA